MKKYLVETYYTCSFKTVHKIDKLDERELNELDKRDDGEVEVLEIRLNNRKTRKLGEKSHIEEKKSEKSIINNQDPDQIKQYQKKTDVEKVNIIEKFQKKIGERFKMPDRRKGCWKSWS